ncbi:hypothetical protein K466DRAFT_592537 [Polyporus arcularius HHB13444]|uniref:Uncharacterized protein n=1 Tax=Polyporus arcularius HHB13444 TaxID=1314778 RepID=A0A5C3NRX3_9APHY|nr:hypothetical protein K466DRAFT_592537 [Polyporus arcularius HHB13444]
MTYPWIARQLEEAGWSEEASCQKNWATRLELLPQHRTARFKHVVSHTSACPRPPWRSRRTVPA